jgi:hypothetical protein
MKRPILHTTTSVGEPQAIRADLIISVRDNDDGTCSIKAIRENGYYISNESYNTTLEKWQQALKELE